MGTEDASTRVTVEDPRAGAPAQMFPCFDIREPVGGLQC